MVPIIELGLEPYSRGDQQKLLPALPRLLNSDSALMLRDCPSTGLPIIGSGDEKHLAVALERLRVEFGVRLATSLRSRPAFRECIQRVVRRDFESNREFRGCYFKGALEVAPNRGKGFAVVRSLSNTQTPERLIDAFEAGIRASSAEGPYWALPTVDIKVTLIDVSYDPNDSSEHGHKRAGFSTFRSLMKDARPILVEPIAACELRDAGPNLSRVIEELRRRGISDPSFEQHAAGRTLEFQSPVDPILGLTDIIQSIAGEEPVLLMQFSRYQTVPEDRLKSVRPLF